MLKSIDRPLSACYDLAVLDLDGVVYVGRRAVPGVADALTAARAAGMRSAYVTNNAARTPRQVAEHLVELGIPAVPADVVTGAQAAARLLLDVAAPGDRIYVMGGEGLEEALRERGFSPVTVSAGAEVEASVAVVQGYGPQMPWSRVVRGAMLVRDGLPWVVSNTDMTFPTDWGLGPGSGTLVRLVADFAGRTPRVAGKPEPALYEETLERVGGERPLMVGDRGDTDIEGACRLGWDSLLVLTGVTGLAELVALPAGRRPTYLATGLAALQQPHPAPESEGGEHRLGGWTARVHDGDLVLEGQGGADDWWRCAAVAAWQHADEAGRAPGIDGLRPPRTVDSPA